MKYLYISLLFPIFHYLVSNFWIATGIELILMGIYYLFEEQINSIMYYIVFTFAVTFNISMNAIKMIYIAVLLVVYYLYLTSQIF